MTEDGRLEPIRDTVARLRREVARCPWEQLEAREEALIEAESTAAKDPAAVVPRF